MTKIRVLTWNVCGDAQARADLAEKVIKTEKPDIMLFQEARKTKPKESNLFAAVNAMAQYSFLFCDEYPSGGIPYGGQNYYRDTSGKCYYCFYLTAAFSNPTALQRVDYKIHLAPGGNDPNASLLTTRAPAYVGLRHVSSGSALIIFTWHAPLSSAGGGVFNAQAHGFFSNIADQMVTGKVGIIAGDMNATGNQIAKTYSNIFEAAGHNLDHVLTNQKLRNCSYYDDVKSDVHYLYLADIEWP